MGEAPGGNEEKTGRLFSGAAGQLLDELLQEVGLKREWFFVTNAVKCRPPDNRTPSLKEIRSCVGSYLAPEVALLRPDFGLVLGNAGLQAVYGKKGITAMNGKTFDAMGTTWVAGFHPAAVLRNPKYRHLLLQALLVFARLVRNEEGAPVTNSILVNTKEKLTELIEEMKTHKWGSLDVETWSSHPGAGRFKGGGLAWWHDDFRIVSINFSFTPGRAYVLPLWHANTPWKRPDQVLEILKPYIQSTKWAMHNGKYDSKCMEVMGVPIRHSFDTMGAAYALDENNLKDLGFMSQVYLAAPEYKEMIDKGDMIHAPMDKLVDYGGKDADYTLRLKGIMSTKLKSEPLSRRLYNKLLLPADVVLTSVEYAGQPLHRGKLVKRREQNHENVLRCLDRIENIAGMKVNPNSVVDMKVVLYDRLGLPIISRTKGGQPSTDEATLIRLADLDNSGITEALIEYRQWQGYESRYFNPWSRLMDENGRLHTNFKPFHTVTGRLSSENPNMQQVPRDTFIRGIIGGRKGWKIVEVDYSQVELRLVAHYSQDKAMLRAFHTGRDIHLETAMAVTGLPESEITSEIRKKAKAVNFGFVYGMGWKKFKEYAKTSYGVAVSDGEAQAARDTFFSLYAGLLSWHERQRSAARRRGWVISAIGRKRHLHDIESTETSIRLEAERQAINSPVQSLASDMTLLAMVLLHDLLDPYEARVMSTVHDALLFEIREECLGKYVPMIVELMENLPLEEMFESRLTIPITVDVKVGDFWSEKATTVDPRSL